jgi:hypothetical protein
MRAAVFLVAFTACSVIPASALIRAPVDSKCQSYGLKGCPELVDGAIAYVEGNKPLAIQKLEAARSLNTPAQLKQFAMALRTIGEASDSGQPLVEVAALLSGEAKSTSAVPTDAADTRAQAAPVAAAPTAATAIPAALAADSGRRRTRPEEYVLLALTAPNDPMRQVTETVLVADAPAANCQISGSQGTCARRRQGPVIITDLVASEECGSRVFLLVSESDTPAFGYLWMLPARPVGVHGGHFAVRGGQWVFVGVKPPAKPQVTDRACFVTWSGYVPRLVPGSSNGTSDPRNPYFIE